MIQCSEHSWDNLYPVHHPQKSSTNPLPRKNNKNKIKTKKTNKQKNKTKQTNHLRSKFSLPTIALRSAMDCDNVALRCISAPPQNPPPPQTQPQPPAPPKKQKTKLKLKTTTTKQTTKQTNLRSNNFLCRSAMVYFHIALCCIVTGINNAINVAMLYGYPILNP